MHCSLNAACLSKNFYHRFSSAIVEWERKKGYLVHVYWNRGGNYKRLLLYIFLLISTDSNLSVFLSTLTDSPLFLLFTGVPVTVLSFLASKISGSRLLIKRSSSPRFLSLW